MKLLLVGSMMNGVLMCGKTPVSVTNVSKEPLALPASGSVVLEADNFMVHKNQELGTESLSVNVTNFGLVMAGGDMGVEGRISILLPAGISRDFEAKGSAFNGSIAVEQGWGDRKTSIFLDAVAFKMPLPLLKGDQVLFEGRLELDQFQHQGRDRSKVRMVIQSYNRQKASPKRDGSASGGAQAQGNQAPRPAQQAAPQQAAPAQGGFGRPQQPAAAAAPQQAAPAQGGFGRPAPARQPENNLPEIDINEDEIPF